MGDIVSRMWVDRRYLCDWENIEKTLKNLKDYEEIEHETEFMKIFLGFFLYLDFETLTEYNGFLTEV